MLRCRLCKVEEDKSKFHDARIQEKVASSDTWKDTIVKVCPNCGGLFLPLPPETKTETEVFAELMAEEEYGSSPSG